MGNILSCCLNNPPIHRFLWLQCFVYQLPARASNKGHVAAQWDLEKPVWRGRLKVSSVGSKLTINLVDPSSGAFRVVSFR